VQATILARRNDDRARSSGHSDNAGAMRLRADMMTARRDAERVARPEISRN